MRTRSDYAGIVLIGALLLPATGCVRTTTYMFDNKTYLTRAEADAARRAFCDSQLENCCVSRTT